MKQVRIPVSSSIVLYQSEWQAERLSVLVYHSGELLGFLQIRRQDDRYPYPQQRMSAYRFPETLAEAIVDGWHGRLLEPLPSLHRPYEWNAPVLSEVASQASESLLGILPRPEGTPDHWSPIHGDLTPWNLRVDRHGRLWLIDWELARWGPPLADLLRFATTELTITGDEPEPIALQVAERLSSEADELREAASFWLSHPIFSYTEDSRSTEASDSSLSRGYREVEVLRLLADGV